MEPLPFWRADVPLPFNNLKDLKQLIQRPLHVLSTRGGGGTVEIEGGLIVKHSTSVFFSELSAMTLVRTLNTVPIPKPLFYSQEVDKLGRHRGYLVMEKVEGVPLSSVLDDLSANACQVVAADLKRYIDALHRLDNGSWGMVDIIQYFITASNGIYQQEKNASDATECIARIDLDQPSKFSHSDLIPTNIMVDYSTGRITSIIDWEYAGWYPYFWNYFIADRKNSQLNNKNWKQIYTESMNGSEHARAAGGFGLFDWNADIYGAQDFSPQCQCCTRT